jgi:hypothetical protein
MASKQGLALWRTTWSYLQWAAMLAVLVSAAWWWRVFHLRDLGLETFHFYHFGYFSLALLAIVAWLLTGGRGLMPLVGDGALWWLVLLWQLALWGRISIGAEVRNWEVALGESSEFIVVVVFVTAWVANPPPRWAVLWALTLAMLLQVGLGIGQTFLQGSIGLEDWFGWAGLRELPLDPSQSGTSVIGAERYLRPYGLSAHPNLWVAGVILGFFAALGGFFYSATNKRGQALWLGCLALGWWGLWLSFSRAALLGTFLGGLALVLFMALQAWQQKLALPWRKAGMVGAMLLAVTFLFMALYPDLTLGRWRGTVQTEGGQASTFENFSAASRAVYMEQALDLIPQHLWRGVGRGNFAWESAYLLYCCDDRDLRGDHVHNIYVLAWAEVGLVGLVLWGLALLYGLGLVCWRGWQGQNSPEALVLLGGVLAWLVIGWFDHYAWTQFGHQLLFWSLLASAFGKKIQKPTLPT